ncbi:MAG: hypothetical protein ABI459_03545 [Deltaproteobacteria bacterium]
MKRTSALATIIQAVSAPTIVSIPQIFAAFMSKEVRIKAADLPQGDEFAGSF